MKSLFKFYIKIRNKSREPAEKKPRCLHNLRRKTTSTAQFTPYTWVYRWQNEREFDLNKKLTTVEAARHAIVYNTDTHRYLKQILENKAHIVVYHKAGESKLKHCPDIDHFHMITWHHQHPTSEHGFILLKKKQTYVGKKRSSLQRFRTEGLQSVRPVPVLRKRTRQA